MDYLQDYPTTPALAKKAWAKFKKQHVKKLLEPHAGSGNLVQPWLSENGSGYRTPQWDAVELNPNKYASLREKGATIVGHDFLDFEGCAQYSHIIMNPPFRNGVKHLLHAWNGIYDGEIVAILNAETIKNSFSGEREFLLKLIEQHGSVEFLQDEFMSREAERTTSVEIALIHLVKKANGYEILGTLFDNLAQDEYEEPVLDSHADVTRALALPENFVQRAVRNFKDAVEAAKALTVAESKMNICESRLGKSFADTMAEMRGEEAEINRLGETVRDHFSARYLRLKDKAWARIVTSADVKNRVSSGAYTKLMAEFEAIKQLDFSVSNIYGFLEGLCYSAADIQAEMICEVFDKISMHHSENTVYYRGWKSNDKHRTMGLKVKKSRFIIPNFVSESYSKSAPMGCTQLLSDFDKVFAILNGKSNTEENSNSLVSLFASADNFSALKDGARLSSAYFDVRYYAKRGTIHFFPKSQELMDKLNRFVGKKRQWLPPQEDERCPDFNKHYEQAETFHSELMERVELLKKNDTRYRNLNIENLTSRHEEYSIPAHEALCSLTEDLMKEKGLNLFPALAKPEVAQLTLL